MPKTLQEIQEDIKLLEPNEKMLLIQSLIADLDNEKKYSDLVLEKEFLQEIRSRYQDYKEGKMEAIPTEEVFEEVKLWLKNEV